MNEIVKFDRIVVKGDFPEANGGFATCHQDQKLYIFGGELNSTTNCNSLYQYNLQTKKWKRLKTKGDIPSPRANTSIVLYKEKIICFGGEQQPDWKFLNDIFELNLFTLQWKRIETKGDIPSERHSHSCLLYDNQMIIHGGINSISISKDIYSLNLDTYTWKELQPNTPLPRKYSHQMTMKDDIITLSGGFPINHDEKYYYQLNFENMNISFKELIGDLPKSFQPPIQFQNTIICFPSLSSKTQDFMKVSISTFDKMDDIIQFKKIQTTNTFPLGRRFRYFFSFESELLIFSCNASKGFFEKSLYKATLGLLSPFTNDIRKIFDQQIIPDFKIQSKLSNQFIQCHKCIIQSRSPFFKELFKKEVNKIEIDYSIQDIELCIEFMYTGLISKKVDFVNLLKISYLFGLKDLILHLEDQVENGFIQNLQEYQNSLKNDIKSLFNSKELSDVKIKSNEENISIFCHKSILSSRCDFFKSIFSIGMKETNSNSLILIEIKNDDDLESIIKYLYGFEIEDFLNEENCLSLYLTSRLLGLKELEIECLSYMTQILEMNSIFDLIQIAEYYSDLNLKNECFRFICENKEKLSKNDLKVIKDEKLYKFIQELLQLIE
eukprot:gene11905-5311_t